MKAIYNLDVPVDSKAPKYSSPTEEVPQGKNHGARSGLRRKQSLKHTSESTTKASKFQSSHSKKETKSRSNPSVLVDKTKSGRDGLKTAHTTSSVNEESGADDISQKSKEEENAENNKDTEDTLVPPPSLKSAQIQELMAQIHLLQSQKEELEQAKVKAKAEVALIKAKPSYLDINQLTELLVTSLKPELSKLLASHDFASCLAAELKELPSKITGLPGEIKELKQHIKDMEIELPRDLNEIPSKLETFTSTISSLSSQVAELKNIQWELPAEFLDLPHLVSSVQEKLKTLNSLPGATTTGVPLADKATASPAKGEKDADTNLKNKLVDLLGIDIVTRYCNKRLLYEKYCEKMKKIRQSSKIINYEVLTKKGPISLKVYREDGIAEVIEKFKVSDLQLAE
ncbi:hypothetical protein Tco_0422044 [Tanacetum coccineum]